MINKNSRLIWDWQNEKTNIEGFLNDPLEWIAKQLDEFYQGIPGERLLSKDDFNVVPTIIEIMRFINLNKKLLIEQNNSSHQWLNK